MDPQPGADYIEALNRMFERLGGWSFDRRNWVLAACLVLLVAAFYFAGTARFDASFEAYFDTDDPTYAAYNRFRADFGSDEIAYILYSAPDSEHGPFDLEVMRKIEQLTRALEGVPFVSDVTSLANAEYMYGVPGGLKIEKILEEFPESQQEMLVTREKVLAKPLYVGGLVSADGQYAAIILDMQRSSVDPVEDLRLDPEGGDQLGNLYPQVTYHAIEEILARPEYDGIVFHHVGDVALNAIYNEIIGPDMARLFAVTIVVIALLLFLFFRRPLGLLGPILVVMLSLVVSLSVVGLLGWKFDLMIIMLPTLLIAVGVADSVHIISEFRVYHAELGDRREAARRTLYLVGTPCLLTSLTTAAGFASMYISPIESIAHFAVYSAAGVLAAFVLSVTLLIYFLSLGRQTRRRDATEEEILRAKGGDLFQTFLLGIANFAIRYRGAILITSGAIFIASAAGISRITVDSSFMNEFKKDEPIRVETELVDEVMGGTASVVYLFDSGIQDGVKEPAFLADIERLQLAANANSDMVKKTYSIGDLLKDVNMSFHDEDPAFYALPESRNLAAQYMLLYEMSGGEELDSYLSSDYSTASLEVRVRMSPTSELRSLVDTLNATLDSRPTKASSVTATGIGALWLKLQEYITTSQIRGFLLAFSVIGVLLCLIFQSVRTGLIAMVPNLTPVVLTLGVMGWMEIPLDYIRLMIATVAIGISVDDTIHYMTRLRHEFRETGSYEEAIRRSISDVGRALVITSIVLVAGFTCFMASRLETMLIFGSLLSGTIVTALVADLLLMPALILRLRPWGPERSVQLASG